MYIRTNRICGHLLGDGENFVMLLYTLYILLCLYCTIPLGKYRVITWISCLLGAYQRIVKYSE